jgi:putative transposase
MIDKYRHQHPVARLCALVDVAKSGYQAWCAGKVTSPRKLEDVRLVVAIKAAHQRGRNIYGPEKIQSEMLAQGIAADLNRIKRLRRLHGIRCLHKKKFKVTTDSKHQLPIADNVLNRQFAQTAPNQVRVGDITYMALGHLVPTDEGWLYLAAVKDLYTCEIVGWAMGKQMTKQLAIDALRAAYWRNKPPPGLLHHSDRGSQYCSGTYRALQVSYKMKTSMALGHPVSRKGDCWDNAPMESFFGTLKTECLHRYKFKTRDQARQVVFDYIDVFYNRIRRHATIQNQAPADYAREFYKNELQIAA